MNNLEPLMTSARTGDKSKDQYLTPLWLFDLLNLEFNFDLDVAATDENTLCDYWFTEEHDGLIQPWWGNVWCNFPYSSAADWVKKAYSEAKAGNCTAVLLMPARTDTKYFFDYCRWGEVRFLPSRLKFEHENGVKNSAPFPSCIVVFHKGMDREPTSWFWEVRAPK